MFDPLTLLALLGPLVVELGKTAIGKWQGKDGFQPATVEDFLKVRAADVQLFTAMNNAGGANASYPWVEAVVRLQRPLVGGVVIGVWALQEISAPGGASQGLTNFANAVGFYLFADRTLFHLRQLPKAGAQ
jgi:hypothetical protein